MRILLVEDETELARRVVSGLTLHGITCESVESAEDAKSFTADDFNVIIVDLGLPGMSGLQLVKLLRSQGFVTPILILTARSSWQEKVEGLNAGADDYLVKPIRIEELAARLQALARRAAGHANVMLTSGDLSLDPSLKQAYLGGKPVSLTASEFRLLLLFMYNPKQTLSQGKILDHLYPLETDRDLNTVEVLIGRLRKKIGRDRIMTVRGLGYRLQS